MKKRIFQLLLISSTLLFASSCKKEIERPAVQPENFSQPAKNNIQEHEKKIYVSNLEELYAAVNDPANEGSQVVLSPGTYVLSAGYPNGGRLELQTDMGLQGQPGQSDAVLIDESALPNSSFRLTATTSTGGIRMGRGSNALEWLSIKGGALAANPFSAIETDLGTTETNIGISHVNLNCNGSRIGIMLRNRLSEHEGRIVNVNLEHCEITGAVNTLGFGIALQNRISGSRIKLNMKGNYIHANKIGILIFNGPLASSIDYCTIDITSHDDRIEGNGCGIDPSGASNGSGTTYANNNTVNIKMYGSTIRDNNPPGHPELIPTNGALPGGMYIAGGYNSLNNIAAYNKVSNNTVRLECWGCVIGDNNGTDIYAYGAWSPPAAILAGTNNLVEIYLRGVSANATVDATASVPVEPAGTNIVNVFRN